MPTLPAWVQVRTYAGKGCGHTFYVIGPDGSPPERDRLTAVCSQVLPPALQMARAWHLACSSTLRPGSITFSSCGVTVMHVTHQNLVCITGPDQRPSPAYMHCLSRPPAAEVCKIASDMAVTNVVISASMQVGGQCLDGAEAEEGERSLSPPPSHRCVQVVNHMPGLTAALQLLIMAAGVLCEAAAAAGRAGRRPRSACSCMLAHMHAVSIALLPDMGMDVSQKPWICVAQLAAPCTFI